MGSEDLLGQRFGEFELLLPLARGGAGSVYLARQQGEGGLERIVAAKCIPSGGATSDDAARVLDEIRVSALLRHPNIATTTSVREAKHHWILISEYIEGESLASVIRQVKASGLLVPLPVALRIAHDAARGLQAAHDQTDLEGAALHIVHRDVSPENLLVGVDGTTRVIDFGIAKAEGRAGETRDATIQGKPPYMAPEVVRADSVDARADLFSLGSVLFELVTLARPFDGKDDSAILMQVLVCDVGYTALQARSPELAAALAQVLTLYPDERVQHAREFARLLEQCGELATHDAVSEWLKQLCKERLEDRRARIAAALAIPAAEPPAVAPLQSKSNAVEPMPRSRAPLVILGIAALGLCAVAAGLAIRTERARKPATDLSAPSATLAEAAPPKPERLAELPQGDAGSVPEAGPTRAPLRTPLRPLATSAPRSTLATAPAVTSDLHANPYKTGAP
jgi:eukaryotic-like serine/threonine-protein kinase